MDKELSLVTIADNFKNSVQGLDDLTELVPALPTVQLATGYAMIKAYEKNFLGLVKSIRDELIGTKDSDGNYKCDGRLFREMNGQDVRGNQILKSPDGTILKASRSSKSVLDNSIALEILQDNDLLLQGADCKVSIECPEKLNDLIVWLFRNLPGEKRKKFDDKMKETFNQTYVPNQSKIEELILAGQLPPETTDKIFTKKMDFPCL